MPTEMTIGDRIAEARRSIGMTQEALASAVSLERSVLSKIENGARNVSAVELVALAEALETPIDWFVNESPPVVVSRRSEVALSARTRKLDRTLEFVARDVDFLLNERYLEVKRVSREKMPRNFHAAELLAERTRQQLGVENGPVLDLQDVATRLGLLAFSLETDGDAAYVELQNVGVAVINGSMPPGRRRFSLAHEIGHHLVGDAFEPLVGQNGETERLIDAFAVHLLLPRAGVLRLWNELAERSHRFAAITIAARFHASWSATCNQLRNLRLVEESERKALSETPVSPAESLEVGDRWNRELEPPSVPALYAASVLESYQRQKLSAARAIELLHGSIREDELPIQYEPTLDDMLGGLRAHA